MLFLNPFKMEPPLIQEVRESSKITESIVEMSSSYLQEYQNYRTPLLSCSNYLWGNPSSDILGENGVAKNSIVSFPSSDFNAYECRACAPTKFFVCDRQTKNLGFVEAHLQSNYASLFLKLRTILTQ